MHGSYVQQVLFDNIDGEPPIVISRKAKLFEHSALFSTSNVWTSIACCFIGKCGNGARQRRKTWRIDWQMMSRHKLNYYTSNSLCCFCRRKVRKEHNNNMYHDIIIHKEKVFSTTHSRKEKKFALSFLPAFTNFQFRVSVRAI